MFNKRPKFPKARKQTKAPNQTTRSTSQMETLLDSRAVNNTPAVFWG